MKVFVMWTMKTRQGTQMWWKFLWHIIVWTSRTQEYGAMVQLVNTGSWQAQYLPHTIHMSQRFQHKYLYFHFILFCFNLLTTHWPQDKETQKLVYLSTTDNYGFYDKIIWTTSTPSCYEPQQSEPTISGNTSSFEHTPIFYK